MSSHLKSYHALEVIQRQIVLVITQKSLARKTLIFADNEVLDAQQNETDNNTAKNSNKEKNLSLAVYNFFKSKC